MPQLLDAVRAAGALDRAVYGEQLGLSDERVGAPRAGAGPYMSTLIVPPARQRRGGRI
jgi:hypothetical protein